MIDVLLVIGILGPFLIKVPEALNPVEFSSYFLLSVCLLEIKNFIYKPNFVYLFQWN